MTEERKVKGVALVGLVELVRKNDDKPWDQYLTPEDMKLVNTMFMPSEWYPLEFSQRLVTAFAKIFLKDDPSRSAFLKTSFAGDTMYLQGS